jgi:hypothetical protein
MEVCDIAVTLVVLKWHGLELLMKLIKSSVMVAGEDQGYLSIISIPIDSGPESKRPRWDCC